MFSYQPVALNGFHQDGGLAEGLLRLERHTGQVVDLLAKGVGHGRQLGCRLPDILQNDLQLFHGAVHTGQDLAGVVRHRGITEQLAHQAVPGMDVLGNVIQIRQ